MPLAKCSKSYQAPKLRNRKPGDFFEFCQCGSIVHHPNLKLIEIADIHRSTAVFYGLRILLPLKKCFKSYKALKLQNLEPT